MTQIKVLLFLYLRNLLKKYEEEAAEITRLKQAMKVKLRLKGYASKRKLKLGTVR